MEPYIKAIDEIVSTFQCREDSVNSELWKSIRFDLNEIDFAEFSNPEKKFIVNSISNIRFFRRQHECLETLYHSIYLLAVIRRILINASQQKPFYC
jgi:hypothetical protein